MLQMKMCYGKNYVVCKYLAMFVFMAVTSLNGTLGICFCYDFIAGIMFLDTNHSARTFSKIITTDKNCYGFRRPSTTTSTA